MHAFACEPPSPSTRAFLANCSIPIWIDGADIEPALAIRISSLFRHTAYFNHTLIVRVAEM